jgi:hypothetical protein
MLVDMGDIPKPGQDVLSEQLWQNQQQQQQLQYQQQLQAMQYQQGQGAGGSLQPGQPMRYPAQPRPVTQSQVPGFGASRSHEQHHQGPLQYGDARAPVFQASEANAYSVESITRFIDDSTSYYGGQGRQDPSTSTGTSSVLLKKTATVKTTKTMKMEVTATMTRTAITIPVMANGDIVAVKVGGSVGNDKQLR